MSQPKFLAPARGGCQNPSPQRLQQAPQPLTQPEIHVWGSLGGKLVPSNPPPVNFSKPAQFSILPENICTVFLPFTISFLIRCIFKIIACPWRGKPPNYKSKLKHVPIKSKVVTKFWQKKYCFKNILISDFQHN